MTITRLEDTHVILAVNKAVSNLMTAEGEFEDIRVMVFDTTRYVATATFKTKYIFMHDLSAKWMIRELENNLECKVVSWSMMLYNRKISLTIRYGFPKKEV